MDPEVIPGAPAPVAATPAAPAASVLPSDAPADGRPANVPEKFWNAETKAVNTEALLKSYTELEKAKAPETDPAKVDDAAKAATQAVGAEAMTKFTAEFEEKGVLSPESYESLQKMGIGKDMVDAYIAGQQAMASSLQDKVFAITGGQESYTKMIGWAATNMSEAEVQAYDNAMVGTEAQRSQAVQALKARYDQAFGQDQSGLVNGRASSGSGGYASEAELSADMRDPRYSKDPAYRAAVERKVAATTAF